MPGTLPATFPTHLRGVTVECLSGNWGFIITSRPRLINWSIIRVWASFVSSYRTPPETRLGKKKFCMDHSTSEPPKLPSTSSSCVTCAEHQASTHCCCIALASLTDRAVCSWWAQTLLSTCLARSQIGSLWGTSTGADPSRDPTPKGEGGAPLRTRKLLHGTMCFVGAGCAGDFVLWGALARVVLKGRDFFPLGTALKDRP